MSDATIEQRLRRVEDLLSAVLAKLESSRPMPWAQPSEREPETDLLNPGLAMREKDREIARKKFAHKKFLPDNPLKGNWTDTVGMFGDDPVLKQITDEALRLRELDRQAARCEKSDAEAGQS